MTLEKIETHILSEAEAKATELAKTAREETAKTVADARQHADDDYAAAVARLRAELDNAFGQAVGKLQSRQRLERLRLKTDILENVFRRATDKLLHHDGFWSLTREQLRSTAGEPGTLACRREHRETFAKMIDALNAESDEEVPPLADDDVDILGGFVLRTGKFDVDYSLDAQMETFRAKVLPELLKEAFPEE
ncbi:MAG TPA: V-type ATP synthase subunit E [Planctomycetota bacterium]|nr:V-type ATP synthase subunit E [Planctomycetota bacterium]